MHSLLKQQLKKLGYTSGILDEKKSKKLFDLVTKAYTATDDDKKMLEKSEKKYWDLMKNIGNHYFFYTYNAEGKMTYVSDSAIDLLGYDKEELLNGFDIYFCHDTFNDDASKYAALTKKGIKQEPYECSVFAKDNTLHYLEVTEVPILNVNGELESIEGIVRDITKQHEAQQKVEYVALHDNLTGLCNRKCLNEKLDVLLSLSQRLKHTFAVLFFDLDHFKYINDTLGHRIGDKLLQSVAKRLEKVIRREDILARIGGDEFVLVLANVNENTLLNSINKVLELLRSTWSIDKHELHVTSSIGVAMFPEDGTNRDELMKNADMAMYHAKDLGRDNICLYTDVINKRFHQKMQLEQEMSKALKEGQFELYYQPKLTLENNAILGAEALIRWNHPTLGLLLPDTFIPLSESTGFILKLGQWVVEESCRCIARLNQQVLGNKLHIAVNISTRQFQLGNLYEIVKKSLEDNNVEGTQLSLEITESIMFDNDEKMLNTLHKIKDLGVHIYMDDFGMGYSSLASLSVLPIDTIKIDKKFIHDMSCDTKKNIWLDAILAMGQALEMDIVAEGVEKECQRAYLKERNCYSYQGYLYSKAVPETKYMDMLKEDVA
jgi:diguanylate cyclase (GGDEF)-like protein/PAS domain S-box-containing protein